MIFCYVYFMSLKVNSRSSVRRHRRSRGASSEVEAADAANMLTRDRKAPEQGRSRRSGRGRPRRNLPSGRAALGGLLVTVAVLGTLVSYGRAHGTPKGRFLVATHDVAAGAPITRSDVRVAKFDLPADLAPRVADRSMQAEFVNLVTLTPVRAGEPILTANLARKRGGVSSREVSVSLDPAQAAGGHLQAGDRIDVLATVGSGTEARTELVAGDVPIVRIERTDGSITSSRGALTVTIAFVDPGLELSLAQAFSVAKVQLVRTTGAERATSPRPTRLSARDSPLSPSTAPSSDGPVEGVVAR